MEKKDEIIIESERLVFKLWNEQNEKLAITLWSNPLVCKNICVRGYFTDEEIKERLQKEISNMEKYKVQYWPVFTKENDEFIGCCGLRPYDDENNIYEIGVHLLPEYWGKGLASEAVLRVIDYAFNEMKVNNIFAGHNPNNVASEKMLKKLGFKYIRSEYYEPTGLMHPSYLYKDE